MNGKKIHANTSQCLVAYFSHPGNNYVGGTIVNLPVGNTEVVATTIREMTGGDLFRIEAVNPYPEDYTETTKVAQQELRTSARPKLTGHPETVDSCDVIFLGYPNWWGTMPMPVFTFLEEHDLSGKTIAPFCTHEGSGLGRSGTDIREMCPRSTILDGLAIRGDDVNGARDSVARWLRELGLKK
jgi:flavodoxin